MADYEALMKVARSNFEHALRRDCTDPDCEIHWPGVIEDDASRLNACAWFMAGAGRGVVEALESFEANVFEDRTDRLYFLAGNDSEHDIEVDEV